MVDIKELNNMVMECIQEQKAIGLKPCEDVRATIDRLEDGRFIKLSASACVTYNKEKGYGVMTFNLLILQNCTRNYIKAEIHRLLCNLNLTRYGNMVVLKKSNWKRLVKMYSLINDNYGEYDMFFSVDLMNFLSENKGKEDEELICSVCGFRVVVKKGMLDLNKRFCGRCSGKFIKKSDMVMN